MDGPVFEAFNTPLGETSDVKKLLGSVAEQINDSEDLEFLNHEKRIGKYAAKGILGVGGQGVCILAEDNDLKRTVVIKLYRKGLSGIRRRQILLEGQALAKVRSPYVAQCFSAESFQDRPFLVLEYIEGQTLTEWALDRVVTPNMALDIVRQLAQGLQCVHNNGVIHLDLKPGNVIITKDHKAVLIDFGISESVAESTREPVAGSPSFLAPERLGNNDADPRSDIYGLGAILYFLLTQKAPVEGTSKSQVLGKLAKDPVDFRLLEDVGTPDEVIQLCKGCLAADPSDRIGSVHELIERLPSDAYTQPPGYHRSRFLLTLTLLIATALIVGLGWKTVHNTAAESNAVEENNTKPATLRSELDLLLGETYAYARGESNEIPQRGDFKVDMKFFNNNTPQRDARGELIRPPFLKITQGEVGRMEVTPSRDCYFYVFSLEYRSAGSKKIDRISWLNNVAKNLQLTKSGETFSYELEPKNLSPADEFEFLCVFATTNKIDPTHNVLIAINEDQDLKSSNKESQELTSRLRGLTSDQEKQKLSAMCIPYRVVAEE